MANLTLTPGSVFPSAQAVIIWGLAGVAVTAGQSGYEDNADLDTGNKPKLKLYSANSASPVAQANGVRGIFVNTAGVGQPAGLCISDPAFTHGLAAVTKGDVIIASNTAGALAPVADLAAGWRPAVMLIATSATVAVLAIAQNTTAK